jgi:hypothetical protein
MPSIEPGRRTADLPDQEELVVFLIGMRFNQWWNVRRWLPVVRAMPRMLAELARRPELGLVGSPRTYRSGRTILLVQYWRSFEQLERYARASDLEHLPAWRAFNQQVRDNGSVGIFHETYRVRVDQIEAIYANMPPFGLGEAFGVVSVGAGRHSAAARLGLRDDTDVPVSPY